MTTDAKLMEGAIRAWTANLDRTTKLFCGLSNEALARQVAPGKNRAIYLWGHLAATHDRMSALLGFGERLRPELAVIFYDSPDRVSTAMPARAEVQGWWHDVNLRLEHGFAQLSPADWLLKHSAVSQEDFLREPFRNRLSILLARTGHLSYHLGQLVLLAGYGR